MRRSLALAQALVLSFHSTAFADICNSSEPITYPLDSILMEEAAALRMELFETFPMALLPPTPKTTHDSELWKALRALPQPQQDVLLLELLDHSMTELIQIDTAPHTWPDEILATMEEVLRRYDLVAQIKALQQMKAAIPYWQEGAAVRKARLSAEYSAGAAGVEHILQAYLAATARFQRADPAVGDVTGILIASNAALAASYEARRQAVPEEARLQYLESELLACLDAPEVVAENGQLDYSALQAPRGTLLLLSLLTYSDPSLFPDLALESLGTAVFNNAPEMAQALVSAGLPVQAEVVERILEALPHPFPRDESERRGALAQLDATARQGIVNGFAMLKVGKIRRRMAEIAREHGMLPQ